MSEPTQTPYSKVNIVDAEGNLIPFGGSSNDNEQGLATSALQQAEIDNLEQISTKLEEIKDFGSPVPNALLPAGGNKLIGWLSAIWQILINSPLNPPSATNVNIPDPFPVSSTASVIPLNPQRKGLTIYNPLSFDIFVGFRSTVSNTSYAVKIPQDFYWEAPYWYTGIISIASSGANAGNIQVRELV